MPRPMLDSVELQQVQKVEAEDHEVLAEHGVPALEGDFLQDLGRRVTRLNLIGVMTGPESGEGLKTLREKFKSATPVTFVDDIATATKVGKVLIEEFGVRELAGKPARFEYELTLREFLPPPKPEQEEPPPPPPEPVEPVEPEVKTGTLIVEVIVAGDANFDFSKVTVTVEGTKDDRTNLTQTLTTRVDGVWTEEKMALGQFTAKAVVTDPPMSGSARATVRSGEKTRVQIILRPGAIIAKAFVVHFRFDKAFVEPCMTEVLEEVAQYASAHNDEKLLIVGHTDKTGSNQYNQSLSERRARSVYAYLTFGRDAATATISEAEWNTLRQQATGGLPQIKDTWGTREYQYILQDLNFYPGNIDGDHGPITSDGVRQYRTSKGLPSGTTVDDAVWAALIHDYMAKRPLNVPDTQFLPNAKGDCDSGVLKWLGCGEESPLPLPQPPTENPHRPYRRVEMLFVKADRLPCDVPPPDTFDLPTPGTVNPKWCLAGTQATHSCFATRNCAAAKPGQWCIEPAEPGTVIVRGSIEFDDGSPAARMKYVLTAPDGEFMDGEAVSGARRGDGIFGVTKDDGTFEYPDKPKGVGRYTMEVIAPLAARNAADPPQSAKGNVVCTRLETADTPAKTTGDKAKKFPVKVGAPAPTGPQVHPHIQTSPAVVVPKPYTSPGRQSVKLTADKGFTGTGKLERVGTAISFFDQQAGGKEIKFDGKDNVFPDARLTSAAGVEVFAQAVAASLNPNDVTLTLTLTPGPGAVVGVPLPAGPPTKVSLTAVELTLDICTTRTTAGVEPAPLPQPAGAAPAPGATDKWFGGRPVHVRSGTRGKRALLIVKATKPADFAGIFVLQQVIVNGVAVGGLDTKAKLFDTEIGGAAKGSAHEFNGPIPPAGKRFFVEGATVSGGLRDTGFQLGIKGSDNDGDRIALTVFTIDKIDAKLRATPCKRAGTRADVMPAKSSIADSKTFDASAITIVKECGDLKLTATAKPAGVVITWKPQRAADDTGLAGLPSDKADPLSPTDNKQRVLTADATGSFHVHAFVDVNGSSERGDDEDGLILNVNIVNIEVRAGAGNNQIITKDGLFTKIRSTATSLAVNSGGITGPAVNAVYTDAEFLKHALAMKVIVKLTGGGAAQLRGTDKIGLGYIQQTPSDSVKGTYADGRTAKEVIVADTTLPPSAANTLAFPVRDALPTSVQNTGPFINSSSDSDKSPIATGGQQRIVRFIDSPGIGIGLTHPATTSALSSISGSNDFEVFLSAFSNDFDENYTVIASAAWSITYGTFTAAAGWTNAAAHVTGAGAMTVLAKPTPAESANVERCTPNFVDNFRMDPS